VSSEKETPEAATIPQLDLDGHGHSAIGQDVQAPRSTGAADDDSLEFADAMILGEANIEQDAFEMIEGTHVDDMGNTNSFLLYASGATTRGLSPVSVPLLVENTESSGLPLTPYERFLLDIIDGLKTVRDIQTNCGLDHQEIMTTLLTLLDKKLITFSDPKADKSDQGSNKRPVRIDRNVSVLEEEIPRNLVPALDTIATPAPNIASSPALLRARGVSSSNGDQDTVEMSLNLAKALTSRRKIKPIPSFPDERNSADSTEDLTAEVATYHGLEDEIGATQSGDIVKKADGPLNQEYAPLHAALPDHTSLDDAAFDAAPLDAALPDHTSLDAEPFDQTSLESASLESASIESASQRTPLPKMPAAITELSDNYIVSVPKPGVAPSNFDFGEDEEELSLSLGLPDDHNADLGHRLDRPFSELDLDLDDQDGRDDLPEKSMSKIGNIKNANSDMFNDAVEFAMNELADELSIQQVSKKPDFDAEDNDDELELSDAFLSLEKKLRAEKLNTPAKTMNKQESATGTPAPLRLGSQFLKAIPAPQQPSQPGPAESGSQRTAQKPFSRQRGIIKEVDRRKVPKTAIEPDKSPEPHRLQTNRIKPANRRPAPSGHGLAKADRLFREAISDKAGGNFVSARMNIKLALSFDPDNSLYKETLNNLQQNIESSSQRPNQAMEYYQQATEAEKAGNVDDAIEYLYKALGFAKDPPIYNRLGVLLAMKKMEFGEARKMIETAIARDPSNATFQHNLKKVLTMQASVDVDARNTKPKLKKGLLGFLSRKKKS
jgi:tetratricopeptide (TPR) repeat protein